MRCSVDRHNFAPGSSRCDCGMHTALTTGDLPYPSWVLDEARRGETPHSRYVHATDPGSGRTYLVREYTPGGASASPAQRRRFIVIAKSLRNSPVQSERILFAYTRNGCCYTVADTVGGTPLSALGLVSPDLSQLEDLLIALRELHAAGTAAGPLFHGNLRPENVLADSSGGLHLLHSLYLESVLSENSLPPEYFQEADLLAAADLLLPFAPHTAADRALRLQGITDPLLGATLEYVYGIHRTRPDSAGAALGYLHLLRRAAARPDRALFAQASSISPSPRLRPFLVTPPSAPQPPNPQLGNQRPPTAPPPPLPPFRPVAPGQTPLPPPSARYTPVTSSPATGNSRAPRPKPPVGRRRRGGGCLLPLLVFSLLLVWVVAMLRKGPAAPTSLDFSAEPNPAPRRAPVQLRWSSTGFDRLELDGKRVQANGSRVVIANASHRYRLAGIRPDGSRQIRDLEVNVLPHRTPKPSPAVPLTQQPETPNQPGNASEGEEGKNSP